MATYSVSIGDKVDINGNTMGKNRLDVQLAKDGVHYNME